MSEIVVSRDIRKKISAVGILSEEKEKIGKSVTDFS